VRTLQNFIAGEWVAPSTRSDYSEAHESFGGASRIRTGWGRIGRYTMLDTTDLKTVVLGVGGLD